MAVKKIGMTGGHGFNTSGKRTPDGEREWSFNNKVVLSAINELNTYKDVQVYRYDDPTGRVDIDRMVRVRKANVDKIDAYIEIHHNAFLGKWGSHGGTETYTANANLPETERLARIIHNQVMSAYGLRNRGNKKYNYDVLKFTHMSAVIVEGGFMDSLTDIGALRNDAILKNAGIKIATGIAEYYGLTKKVIEQPKPTPQPTQGYYRVRKSWEDEESQLYAFSELDSAIAIVKAKPEYKVFNNDGIQVYPEVVVVKVEPPLTQDELRRTRIAIKDIK